MGTIYVMLIFLSGAACQASLLGPVPFNGLLRGINWAARVDSGRPQPPHAMLLRPQILVASALAGRATGAGTELGIQRLLEDLSCKVKEMHFPRWDLPRLVDSLLAAGGLVGAVSLMAFIEAKFGGQTKYARMFIPGHLPSSIIFFAPMSPPNPYGFLVGTLGAATICAGAVNVFKKRFGQAGFKYLSASAPATAVAYGVGAALLLLYYKFVGTIFPSCATIPAGMLATAAGIQSAAMLTSYDIWRSSISFAIAPWLTGHAVLWSVAFATSHLRTHARAAVVKKQFKTFGEEKTKKQLFEAFRKFDISGDGQMDATELSLSLRYAIGTEFSTDECKALIGQVDADGDGCVSFEEFEAICRGRI